MKNHGQSIISALVGLVITTITMIVFMSMMATQQKETKGMGEKLDTLELKSILMTTLQDGKVCQFELNNPVKTFNNATVATSAAFKIPFQSIHIKPNAAAPKLIEIDKPIFPNSRNVVVDKIYLKDFVGVGAFYTGNWEVSLVQNKLAHPLAPILIPTTLTIDLTSPSSARKIKACNSSTYESCAWTGWGCNLKCPDGEKMNGIETCGYNTPGFGGMDMWTCIEGCGSEPNGDVDNAMLRILCCQ